MTPKATYGGGNNANEISVISATTVMLIHHGERSRIANSEFSDILNFMVFPDTRIAKPQRR